jgi:Flp pilus assembly protein TadD
MKTFRRHAFGGLLILLTVAAYVPGYQAEFILDDTDALLENSYLQNLSSWEWIWKTPPETTLAERPVTQWLFVPDAIFGWNRIYSHTVNLLIHIATGLLLVTFFRVRKTRESEQQGYEWAAVLLWLIHPINTSAVTYLVQRAESLSALLVMATMVAAQKSWDSRHRKWWLGAAVIFCWLAAGAKETGLMAPIAVILWDWIMKSAGDGRALWRQRGGFYLGLFSSWVPALVMIASGSRIGLSQESTYTSWEYLQIQAEVIPHYLWLMLYPQPLLLDYNPWPPPSISPFFLLQFTIMSAGFLYAVYATWKRVWMGYLLLMVYLFLAPSSSFIALLNPAYEHRIYLGSAFILYIAISLAGAALFRLPDAYRSIASRIAILLFISVLGVALTLTYTRNQMYQSSISIWQDTISHRPLSYRAHASLAALLIQAERYQEALEPARKAIQLDPQEGNHHYNLGIIYEHLGSQKKAVNCYQRAIELGTAESRVYNNLGRALAGTGADSDVLYAFRRAVELDPHNLVAVNNFGMALGKHGQVELGLEMIEAALKQEPNSVELLNTAAVLHAMKGDRRKALKFLHRGLAIDPDNPLLRENRSLLDTELD